MSISANLALSLLPTTLTSYIARTAIGVCVLKIKELPKIH